MPWHFGPFRLDLAHACLWHAEQLVILRPKTFAILVYLVTHAGQLVTKEASSTPSDRGRQLAMVC
jgi:DNA-binding response OmpR family regulator